MTLISCIIPIYNCAAYIAEAIESVLNQSMHVDQLIIVDDGSEDDTPRIVEQYQDRLQYIRKAHTGVVETLNAGLLAARGNFITFLDADDHWHVDKTRMQYSYLMEHPSIDICFSLIQEYVSPELPEDVRSRLLFRQEPLRGVGKTSAMIRNGCFEIVGPFSPDAQMGNFLEWYLRAQELGIQQHMLEEILAYRRVHLSNFTRTERSQLRNFAQILKGSLDRKRMNS